MTHKGKPTTTEEQDSDDLFDTDPARDTTDDKAVKDRVFAQTTNDLLPQKKPAPAPYRYYPDGYGSFGGYGSQHYSASRARTPAAPPPGREAMERYAAGRQQPARQYGILEGNADSAVMKGQPRGSVSTVDADAREDFESAIGLDRASAGRPMGRALSLAQMCEFYAHNVDTDLEDQLVTAVCHIMEAHGVYLPDRKTANLLRERVEALVSLVEDGDVGGDA